MSARTVLRVREVKKSGRLIGVTCHVVVLGNPNTGVGNKEVLGAIGKHGVPGRNGIEKDCCRCALI